MIKLTKSLILANTLEIIYNSHGIEMAFKWTDFSHKLNCGAQNNRLLTILACRLASSPDTMGNNACSCHHKTRLFIIQVTLTHCTFLH